MRLLPLPRGDSDPGRGQLSDPLDVVWEPLGCEARSFPSQQRPLGFCVGSDPGVRTSEHPRRGQVPPLFLVRGPHPQQVPRERQMVAHVATF